MTIILKSSPIKILSFAFFYLMIILNHPEISSACAPSGPGPPPPPPCQAGAEDEEDIEVECTPCPTPPPPPPCGPSNQITYHSGNINLTIPMFTFNTKCEPISIYITYNSQGVKSNGPFGYGWLFPYSDSKLDCKYFSGTNAAFGLLQKIVKTLPGGNCHRRLKTPAI